MSYDPAIVGFYGEIVVEGVGSIMDKTDFPHLPRPASLSGPKPWENVSWAEAFGAPDWFTDHCL